MIKNEYSEDSVTQAHEAENVYGLATQAADVSQKLLLNEELHLTLANLVNESDHAMKQQLIAHNLHLVVKIAQHYCDHGVALYDLVKEGVAGLIYAFKHFEQKGGFRFAAYARQCIRQNIERTLSRGAEHV